MFQGTIGARCGVCLTGRRQAGRTTSTLTRGETTIVVRWIPAAVCDTCGDITLSSSIERRLDELAESAVVAGIKHMIRDCYATVVVA